MRTIAFFNNKGGVDKTSLVFHLAWMYRELGLRVIAADLDPQANLSAAFLDEERLEALWPDDAHPQTLRGCIEPLIKGVGDIGQPHVEEIAPGLGLLVGDIGVSTFEDELSQTWPQCLDRKERAFRVTSAFFRAMQGAARAAQADVALVDVGPNLGAINRAAMVSVDYVVVPLGPDLFSLQGLKNLGPSLRSWRDEWRDRKVRCPQGIDVPAGDMTPAGYVVMQHAVRLDRPVAAYDKWVARIPETYRAAVLGKATSRTLTVKEDKNCLALLKHYRSLMPLAQEARKPMFHLRPADGALGAHATAVQSCRSDFQALALHVAKACKVEGLAGPASS